MRRVEICTVLTHIEKNKQTFVHHYFYTWKPTLVFIFRHNRYQYQGIYHIEKQAFVNHHNRSLPPDLTSTATELFWSHRRHRCADLQDASWVDEAHGSHWTLGRDCMEDDPIVPSQIILWDFEFDKPHVDGMTNQQNNLSSFVLNFTFFFLTLSFRIYCVTTRWKINK